MYNRMMEAMDRADLTGPAHAQNHHRVEHQAEIEEAISAWTKQRTAEEVEEVLRGVGVPVGQVFSVKEVVENEHTKARGLVEEVPVRGPGGTEGWTVKMSRVTPVLEGVDTSTRWAGPDLGQHNREVLVDELGLNEEEFVKYQDMGIIGA